MFSLTTRSDPFVSSLEVAAEAAGHRNGADFNRAYEAHQWDMLTPDEQADMLEYHRAVMDDFRWNQMMLRHMNRFRMTYIRADGWVQVPYDDATKAAERARFQGRA